MRFARLLPLALLALAGAGCTPVPDLPASREALDAPWPTLAPLDSLPPASATTDEDARIAADLDAQAAVLKARAAALDAAGN